MSRILQKFPYECIREPYHLKEPYNTVAAIIHNFVLYMRFCPIIPASRTSRLPDTEEERVDGGMEVATPPVTLSNYISNIGHSIQAIPSAYPAEAIFYCILLSTGRLLKFSSPLLAPPLLTT